jgi:hypothetical protein
MAVYESLLLNTVVPQIQAAQAGDSYVMVVNATTPALRITQTGTGDSILVEDAANPDSSPFVVTAAGDVGIGTSTPAGVLSIKTSNGQFLVQNGTSAAQMRISAFNNAGNANAALIFEGYASEYGRFDASGNLGLGVTPSAWDVGKVMQFDTGGAFVFGDAAQFIAGVNAYYQGAWKYTGTGAATKYESSIGQHRWFNAPSGTAGATTSITSGLAYSVTTLGSTTLGQWQAFFSALTGIPSIGQTVTATATGTLAGGATVTQIATFTQAMTLDASGNLGVGTTLQNERLRLNSSSTSQARMSISYADSTIAFFGSYSGIVGSGNATDVMLSATNVLAFGAGGTAERARITSGGDLLVGTQSGQVSATVVAYRATAAVSCVGSWSAATSGDNLFQDFYTEATATLRGSIDYNRAGGLTRYNTTSDYRAKDIYGLLQNTGNAIDSLKVYNGKMKGATQERPMLIAHEAQEVAPYAVSGVKDAVNADGTPKYQQMDVSSLVPLLIAEIQSLRARVAQLEAK